MPDKQLSRRGFAKASLGAFAAAVGLAGCASAGTSGGADAAGGDNAETAAATPGAATPKPAIVVVSFGTSYATSRHITIGAIESDIREAFPDYDVRRAFT
ncbi:MAG: sirohydrochlorin cobaltochelatase, partial [Atopobiaceae bacterium]|nr:sirohydrochlorin cobaltochelatase [Atopobiaceae bacterium]